VDKFATFEVRDGCGLADLAQHLGASFGRAPEVRESSYFGTYYRLVVADVTVELKGNSDPDGEILESSAEPGSSIVYCYGPESSSSWAVVRKVISKEAPEAIVLLDS
jgi:hypothetical protein